MPRCSFARYTARGDGDRCYLVEGHDGPHSLRVCQEAPSGVRVEPCDCEQLRAMSVQLADERDAARRLCDHWASREAEPCPDCADLRRTIERMDASMTDLRRERDEARQQPSYWEQRARTYERATNELSDECGTLSTELDRKRAECDRLRDEVERLKAKVGRLSP